MRSNSLKRAGWGAALAIAMLLCLQGATAQQKSDRSTSIVNIGGTSYYVHVVKSGETLYSLARLYEVSEQDITTNNPQAAAGLRVDQVLKIPVTQASKPLSDKQMARRFDTYEVAAGETAYSISKKLGVSVPILIEDNPGFDPEKLSVGQKLNIRRSEKGSNDESELNAQWSNYTDALSSVTPGVVYHMVKPGETVYGISKAYGIGQRDLIEYNNIDMIAGLKAGTLLKLPADKVSQTPGGDKTTPAVQAPELPRREEPVKKGEPHNYDPSAPMNVAMLLPLTGADPGGAKGAVGRNFLEFYQGALLAVEDLRRQGISIDLNLYDTQRSQATTEQIVSASEFAATDLIIGPVYEESLSPVLDFANKHSVAVVYPLAQADNYSDPLLYQLAPDATHKYDKLRTLLSPDKNVVVISASVNDKDFEAEITPLLPANARRFNYSKGLNAAMLAGLLRNDRENVVVVLNQDEYTIDDFMARLSSLRNSVIARGSKAGGLTVVGSSRWQYFNIADRNLYFKLNLCYVTNYHAGRGNTNVQAFYKRYISSYSAMPTPYSFRGYDAAKLFIGTLASWKSGSFSGALDVSAQQLLEVGYHFDKSARNDNYVNTDWALVCYKSDYTIEVK